MIERTVQVGQHRLEEMVPFDLSSYKDRQYLISAKLRYCPTCLQHGYHSMVFQHRAIMHCPIHGDLLVKCCLRCKGDIAATFSSIAANPFECRQCGDIFGATPTAKQVVSFASKVQQITTVRISLEREGRGHGRHSHLSTIFHRSDLECLSDRRLAKLLRTAYPDLHYQRPTRNVIHQKLLLDDLDEEGGDYSGIWIDALAIYLEVKRHIEQRIGCANRDYEDIHELLGFGAMEISVPGIAYSAGVALYQWRYLRIPHQTGHRFHGKLDTHS
ncbi:hypothetical protein ACFOFO_01565, partial [Undibacterium arcticum]